MTEQPGEHASITRFRTELERRGGTGRIVVLPDSVHTAQLAADALGCEVGAIANSLLFEADGEPLLLLTSGAHRVDTTKVAAELGITQLKRAKPEFVRHHTSQVIGGVSPFDHPAPPCARSSTRGCGGTPRSGPRPATPPRCSAAPTRSCSS